MKQTKAEIEAEIVRTLNEYLAYRVALPPHGGDDLFERSQDMRKKINRLMLRYVSGSYEFCLSDCLTAHVDFDPLEENDNS